MAAATSVRLPGGDYSIRQHPQGQPVTSDTAFLVDTVSRYETDSHLSMLDLGCGCGIIAIMMKIARPGWEITGVDIQPELVAIAGQNALDTGLEIQFRPDDLRTLTAIGAGWDIVVANPPWVPVTAGKISPEPVRALSRSEVACNASDVLAATERLLKPGGRAYLLYRRDRIDSVAKLAGEKGWDVRIAEGCDRQPQATGGHVIILRHKEVSC